MKFSVDIDCSAQEARTFLGLPDVKAFQKSVMNSAQAQMEEQMKSLDPEALMNMWMPNGVAGTVQSWKELQENFMMQFSQMGVGAAGKKGK
ncbi:MAG: DUF6489 family protein [Rhodospirillales bacterium]|jgi:hypothetical protein|nr:DUF6489 family protein [Rhodospirillales bacterium]